MQSHADPKALTVHPAADAVPELPPRQYAALKDSIARRGINQPLLVDAGGRVVDGRTRLKIALELNLEAVPVTCIAADDPALTACEAAVSRRNLTASGRVLVLYLAHPALKHGAEGRRRSNLIPAARQKKALDVIPVTSRELGEFANFETLANRYGVPREYFSKLAEIERRCGGDEAEWQEVQRAILDDERAIPALNAGMGGKAATKGKKRSDPNYVDIVARSITGIANAFKAWPRLKWPALSPNARSGAAPIRARVLAGFEEALRVAPPEIRALQADAIVASWPEHEKAELAALLKRAGKKSGAF